jgi:c-di-GMP-binding flagellar brake protein YcgR
MLRCGLCSIMTMHDIATRLGNTTTGQLLVRSGIEIERVLRSMVDNGTPISAKLPELIFLSKLVAFDPVERLVTVAYSDHKPANTAVLAAKSVTFMANHFGAQLAFACARPRHALFASQPAIRMTAPGLLLAAEPRHNRVRGQVPGEANVECDLRMGLITFKAKLVDMSTDGRAFLLGDPAIPLCSGTEMKRVQIKSNGYDPIEVDIHVEQVLQAVLPNGARATRIGCRIITDKERLEKLIRFFVIELR